MRPPLLNRWTYSDKLEGLLLFAQALEESLFDYTIDTFRPPALNTFYRCIELLHALAQVRRASLHVNTLTPMVEELALSLEVDDVAASLVQPHRDSLVKALRESATRPAELERIAAFLRGRLRLTYRKALEKRLKELLAANHEKNDIIETARAWVTQLINEGSSPGHIFYSATQRFFSAQTEPKISDVSEVDAFFETFLSQPTDWEVVFKVGRSFSTLETVAPDAGITLSEMPPPAKSTFPGERAFLEENPDEMLFATMSPVKARDALSARNRAENRLRELANLGYLHAHRLDFVWKPDALVYNVTTKWVVHLDKPTPHVLKRPDCPEGMLGEMVSKTYDILDRSSFDPPSTVRLLQVLDLHASALKASTPENQVLNFWAAIETLLPPPSEPGRIVHIVNSASPLLCRAYPLRIVRYVLDALRGFGGTRVDSIVAKVPQGENHFEKVAALVSLKSNEAFRDKLYALCKPNPLLRYRLYWAFKNLNTAPAIRALIERHRKRVDWHIQRIYRSRNLILHAGETMPYLGTLIENVHSYLDRMLDLVRHALETHHDLRSIDSSLLEVSLDHSAHMDLLLRAGKAECAPDTFLRLLFGARPDATVVE